MCYAFAFKKYYWTVWKGKKGSLIDGFENEPCRAANAENNAQNVKIFESIAWELENLLPPL